MRERGEQMFTVHRCTVYDVHCFCVQCKVKEGQKKQNHSTSAQLMCTM